MSTVVRKRTSGLPLELSSFVGRRREVDEVKRLLSASRLVTLTGPGGVGKTRLALEVSRAVHRAFPAGVVLVELDQVRDAELVANAVAQAVGMREAARTSLEMLVDYLSSRRLLLVLDNSEHLVDAVAELAGTLLHNCQELRILATSREWLGIVGEAVMPVPPLTLPDPDRAPAEQDLSSSEAVTLFAERAASVRLGFTVNAANGSVVAEICHRLDGLPLAIELAAARVRALSEQDVLARLLDPPQSSTAGRRLLPARQQTIRSCIEWSHSLCNDPEKLLWARLSVFAGGFELDSVEDVCSGGGLAAQDVLDTLASLLDKSILVGEQHGNVMRYRMLETIREFGVELLDHTGEHAALRRRHRDFHLRLIERANDDWVSARQVDWFARLDREHANNQAAVDYSLREPGELDAAFRMLTGLFHFYWWGRGWAREGRLWLARALDQPCPPSADRARALLTDGSLAAADGQFDFSRQRLADARAIDGVESDPTIAAFACWVEGSVSLYSGDLPAAIAVFARGLALLPPGVDVPRRLDLMVSYSSAVGLAGDVARATACHQEWLMITEPAGECFHRSYALWSMGLFAMAQGDHDRGAELYRKSIALRRDIRDLTGIGWSTESLSWVECALGHPVTAATLLGAADRLWEIMGRPLRTYQHLYPYHEQTERATREQLGTKGFDEAYEHGRMMDVDDAIAFALNEQPAAPPAVEAPPNVLTRREREIAGLIAEGLTSREIAERLVISVRTAETHTEHILTKLGFKSRVQVATWVSQQRS